MADKEMDFDPLVDDLPSRFVVGIDLGTTNSAVAYVDTKKKSWSLENFKLPQLIAPGEIDARDTLPSFHYEPARGEISGSAIKLPWDKQPRSYAVGIYARDHGTESPDRMIASAKSWLCHAGVDRTANLLPWHGADEVERLSPVEVSSRFFAPHARRLECAFSARPARRTRNRVDIARFVR